MFVFETVVATVQVAEAEHAPTNSGQGQPAPYCSVQ
nr:TPA_inf: a2.1 [Moesziomyces antarcticus]